MSVSRHGRPCPGHPRGSATNLSAAQTSVNSVAYDEAAGFSWVAGLVPRLSGSSWAQAELELRRVEWRGRRGFSEPCGIFSVHQIGAHESNELEEARTVFRDLLQHAQPEMDDEGDGDLDAHRVFRSSDELRDPERLLHHPEEQFDLPAALVEAGDLLGRRVEVVGENAQPLAGFGLDGDFAHRLPDRIFALVALTGGQEPDVIAQNVRSLGQGHGFGLAQRRVGLEAGHQTAARAVELRPPGEVVVTEVEDIGGARVD